MRVFRLGVLGDFDLDDLLQNEADTMQIVTHVWFYLTSLSLTVLMMNILIGILSANYDRFEDQSKQLFTLKRARVICFLSTAPWYHRIIWHGTEDEEYLFIATKGDSGVEQERSVRGVIQAANTKIQQQMAGMQEQIGTLANVLDQINGKLKGSDSSKLQTS